MPSLTEVRDAAVALLQNVFPDLPRVEAFSGEITIDAVADKRLPAGVSVLVAALAADNDAAPGSLDFDVVASVRRAGHFKQCRRVPSTPKPTH